MSQENKMTESLYLNAEDVAMRLQISTPTIYRWVKSEKFPAGEKIERIGMAGPRHTTLWDIRVVDQWAIDNHVLIRVDPTLPDREYLGLVDDPAWVKTAWLVAYAIGAGAISSLLYSWVF
jgi:predicted DNA-binding transcriptional regulator AlpA